MRVDVLVIGGGIAGCVAAASASDADRSVVLVRRGLGATAMSSGCIDLAWDPLARPGETALAATGLAQRTTVADHIDQVLRRQPHHAYSVMRLRTSQVASAAAYLMSGLEDETLIWRGVERPPFLLPTSSGGIRAADICPAGAAAGDTRGLDGLRIAVADFGRLLPCWDASLLARSFDDSVGLAEHFVPLPVDLKSEGQPHPALSYLDLALLIDADRGTSLAEAIAKGLAELQVSHIMLPPACGLSHSAEVLQRIQQRTGLLPFEAISSGPPSVPGVRVQRALDELVDRAGTSVREGRCVGFDAAYGRIVRVHIESDDHHLRVVEPDVVVLCTGRFLGGGLHWEDRPIEAVFGLPVRVGDGYPQHAPPSRFLGAHHSDEQAAFKAGVTVGEDLRPLGPGGTVAYSNLFAAGSVLAGHDEGATRGGAGIALVTGWVAGRAAGRASGLGEQPTTPPASASGDTP